MKKAITRRILPAIALLVILLSVFFPKKEGLQGTRISEPKQFLLTFTYMNGEDTAVLDVKKGDVLHCSWEIASGIADILIGIPGQAHIYRGSRLDRAEFELVIPEDGTYTVTFTARKAAGRLSITAE